MAQNQRLQFGRYDYAAFLTFLAYAAGSVIIPVSLVSIADELGFSLASGGMSEGGSLHLGRTVSMVLAMLACGFAAGRYGTRHTLGYSVLLMSIGIFFCASAHIYFVLFIALLIAGIGEGVIEGLATPFVQNLHKKEAGRYVNITHAFWSIGILLTVLLSGWLLEVGISWRTLTTAVGVLGVIAGLWILLPERHHPYPEPRRIRQSLKDTWSQAIQITKIPQFWLYYMAMFLAGGGEFCLTFWSASHIQLYFDTSPWQGGMGVALFAFAMVLGRLACGYYIPERFLCPMIIAFGFGGSVICAFLPIAPSLPIFYGLLFAAGLASAPFWPSIQSVSVIRLPHCDSTMLLVLLSCAGVPGCGVFTYLMGYLGNASGSLQNSFYLVPAAYLAVAIIFSYIQWKHKARNESEFH